MRQVLLKARLGYLYSLNLTTNQSAAIAYCSHLTGAETEHREAEQLDQGHKVKQVMMLDFKHRSCHCKACALTHYHRLPCY